MFGLRVVLLIWLVGWWLVFRWKYGNVIMLVIIIILEMVFRLISVFRVLVGLWWG